MDQIPGHRIIGTAAIPSGTSALRRSKKKKGCKRHKCSKWRGGGCRCGRE